MDAVASLLIDIVCYGIGRGVWWLARRSGLAKNDLSFWSYVVLGFITLVACIAGALVFWGGA